MIEFPHFYRPEEPVQDKTVSFLEGDNRWHFLPADFQALVLQTAKDVVNTPRDLIEKKMHALDASFDTYSQHLTQEISMITLHSTIAGYLEEQTWMSPELRKRTLEKLIRISLAERLLGKQIAERYGWESATGFGINTLYTESAIELCKSIVRNSKF